jgi:alkaline phosphatase
MIPLMRKSLRWLAGLVASFYSISLLLVTQPALAQVKGNGVNIILMIGDGMGWEMTRAGAIAKGGTFYNEGKGQGLSMQSLRGYTYATTYGTTIQGSDGLFSADNSALDGSDPITGASPVRPDFVFNPLPFNAGIAPTDPAQACAKSTSGGNLVGYVPNLGGPNPWTPISPANPGLYNKEYIKCSLPDSANTATTLYTGVKSYNNAMGVDIYEQNLTTIQEIAASEGKSTGVVTSVPITHATPGAAISNVNRRSKYDADYPALDNILQQSLRNYSPNVILGGGHPLDLGNSINDPAKPGYKVPGTMNYTFIKQSTYEELKSKPQGNLYGYTFLERGSNAAKTLLDTAKTVDPTTGGKLLGLYGARGQEGNIPVSTANGDYSNTGLSMFSVYSTTTPTSQTPTPDIDRPLAAGETTEQFIATEKNQNPTLVDLTKAALEVLGKDPDGFWLMVEGGDIDWSAHDDNMDNLIGTVQDFDKSVQTVIDWIGRNGGWRKNVLIITADHDHYLTINPEFPDLLKAKGAAALTYAEHTPEGAGHFWGSDPTRKYLWGSHSNRPVPVYYQGLLARFEQYIGKGYTYVDNRPDGTRQTFTIPGVPGAIDQAHVFQVMRSAILTPVGRR